MSSTPETIEPRMIDFADLAPYTTAWEGVGELDCCDSCVPDAGLLVRLEVDGVEWVTDRYILVRADRLTGAPGRLQEWVTAPGGVAERVTTWLQPGEVDPGRGISPIYLDLAERRGLTLTPGQGDKWLILDRAEVIGCIQATTADVDHGWRPGMDLTRLRAVVGLLPEANTHPMRAWATAYEIITCLDAIGADQ
ncbi:hypothetical protein EDD28_2414 [Salana multivorans]|uniref:Uncharacterized protein n=1 Tax=Salana multivorans TaxID=120377 RepID=A0A3N2DDD4_9MICO|nr:hypothetical protein [Salana multivorans]ROR97805.1 hypothetical protein EDD28_2414 [Salana multivorans]